MFLGGGLESRFPIESNGDTSGLDVVFVAYCLEDENRTGYSCQFTPVGTLSVVGARNCIDRDDPDGVVMSTENGARCAVVVLEGSITYGNSCSSCDASS